MVSLLDRVLLVMKETGLTGLDIGHPNWSSIQEEIKRVLKELPRPKSTQHTT